MGDSSKVNDPLRSERPALAKVRASCRQFELTAVSRLVGLSHAPQQGAQSGGGDET